VKELKKNRKMMRKKRRKERILIPERFIKFLMKYLKVS